MTYALPETFPQIIPADYMRRPAVRQYVEWLDLHAPSLALSEDRAVALGLIIAQRALEGDLDLCRGIAVAFGHDLSDIDGLIGAAFVWLRPDALPAELATVNPAGSWATSAK